MIVTQESTFNEAAIELFDTQLKNWELAEKNYRSFGANRQKTIQLGNSRVILQHNPARIVSAASKIKPDEAPKRPCFLCPQQLPPQQQKVQLNDLFCLLVNPYPIFYPHFTIAATQHISQQIFPYLPDMLYFSKKLNNFTVFFNGAGAGASAPDHLHFQACKKNSMPVETEWD
ncbi:MAG: DUF4922 domain-containing protein, partial [Bacteroidales bacterium]|nr:DUF4922 domain-containing protein [Bacteroidales bacterium]